MAAILDASDALARMTQLMENAPPPRLSKEDKEMKRPTREWLDSMYGANKKEESSGEPAWVADHVAKNEALRKAVEEKEEMTLVEGDRPYEDEPASTPLLADDRAAVLQAVRQDGFALARAPASFRADEEIVRAAVGQAPRALKYASDQLRANRELVLECVKREGLALHGAVPELGTDPEVVDCVEIKILRRILLNHRVVLHAIDATPARRRGDAGSSPLDRRASPRNDLVKNCRVHLKHCLIST